MLSIAVFSCHVTLTEFFCSRDDVYTFSQSSRFRPFVFALIIFDLKNNFDPRASETFSLTGYVHVHLHGIGGRTVE